MEIKFRIINVAPSEQVNQQYILHVRQETSSGIQQPGQSVMQVHLPDELGKKLHGGQIFTVQLDQREHEVCVN